MTDTAIAERADQATSLVGWTPEQVRLVKQQLLKPKDREASDDELAFFAYQCQRTGLDPFTKQIYGIFRWDGRARAEVMQTQVSIDGLRLVAQRTGEYEGQDDPEWCGSDGEWKSIWTSSSPPVAARVRVWKKGARHPTPAVAHYNEYVQRNGNGQLMGMWRTMPANQLAKCAEALALRKAFPNETSGLHTDDEMAQADNPPAAPADVPVAAASLPASVAASGQRPEGKTPDPTEPLITVPQRRKLWKEAEKAGLKDRQRVLRAVILWTSGTEHTDRIPKSKVDTVYEAIADYENVLAAIRDKASEGDPFASSIVERLSNDDPGPDDGDPGPEQQELGA